MAETLQIFTVTKDPKLLSNFEFADNVYRFLKPTQLVLIVPKNLVRSFSSAYASRNFCKIVDEGEILKESLSDIETWKVAGFPARAGWYFQQFLKLAIAQTSIAQARYVIWDADTIPYRHMSFFDEEMRMLFTQALEFHDEYFSTNGTLIGVNRSLQNFKFSAISQHMPVYKDLMLGLLDRIGQRRNGDWLSAIRDVISDGRPSQSLFSEYEIFADWVRTTHPSQFALRRIPWSRKGTLFTPLQLKIAKQVMYFIAFEARHKGVASQNINLWRGIFSTMLPYPVVSGIRKGLHILRTLRQTLLQLRQSMRPARDIFGEVYEKNMWGLGDKFYSGGESYGRSAQVYVECIINFIKTHNITSVVDLGCGDFAVGKFIAPECKHYVGVDVVPSLVARNRSTFGAANIDFECLDITKDNLPDADLCLVRQVMQHLSNREISQLLGKTKKYRYVIVAEHQPEIDVKPNIDIAHGDLTRADLYGSAVYLDKPPFSVRIRQLAETGFDSHSGPLRIFQLLT